MIRVEPRRDTPTIALDITSGYIETITTGHTAIRMLVINRGQNYRSLRYLILINPDGKVLYRCTTRSISNRVWWEECELPAICVPLIGRRVSMKRKLIALAEWIEWSRKPHLHPYWMTHFPACTIHADNLSRSILQSGDLYALADVLEEEGDTEGSALARQAPDASHALCKLLWGRV